ncbi:MAG: hypothetical protein J6252_01270 [Clostridia bacterium]|nr:hypothetical protein [Clostridia bacterium]
MHIELDKNASDIISRLEACGFSAYAVGGCVRDALLGRAVSDTDVATSAGTGEVKKALSGVKVLDTGIKHGTVTAVIGGDRYEITTYRVESGYSDSRHPDSVTFVRDIVQDLARRDFTVNAMAYSPSRGFCDPFGGREDLNALVIRAVGDPRARFTEDALRILRALRFAAVLGFEIENETSRALRELAPNLKNVSAERILAETEKLVCGTGAERIVNEYKDVISAAVPLNGDTRAFAKLPPFAEYRFACLLGPGAGNALRALRSSALLAQTADILANSKELPRDTLGKKRFIAEAGRENAARIAIYRRALYGEDAEKETERLISSGGCYSVKELEIDGNDLIRLGFSGEEVGRALHALLDRVLRGGTENEKNALCAAALRLQKIGVDNSAE